MPHLHQYVTKVLLHTYAWKPHFLKSDIDKQGDFVVWFHYWQQEKVTESRSSSLCPIQQRYRVGWLVVHPWSMGGWIGSEFPDWLSHDTSQIAPTGHDGLSVSPPGEHLSLSPSYVVWEWVSEWVMKSEFENHVFAARECKWRASNKWLSWRGHTIAAVWRGGGNAGVWKQPGKRNQTLCSTIYLAGPFKHWHQSHKEALLPAAPVSLGLLHLFHCRTNGPNQLP